MDTLCIFEVVFRNMGWLYSDASRALSTSFYYCCFCFGFVHCVSLSWCVKCCFEITGWINSLKLCFVSLFNLKLRESFMASNMNCTSEIQPWNNVVEDRFGISILLGLPLATIDHWKIHTVRVNPIKAYFIPESAHLLQLQH